ncbi:MAG: amino acid/peptide transporter [Acidobacteria bacterium OLB17]|nr:MAG: amino acid/peptide transporter [Acidobacteria bacterium OLB17]MCZ2390256.1 peptide MFS transporter [Acidobacteriota bacterium]
MSIDSAENARPSDDRAFFGHPRGLSTLFFTEMWERFSYYGMRAILMLYMTTAVVKGGLGWTPETAAPIYALYAASVYFLPLIGGWIADRFIGAKRATFVGGVIIMLGHFTLAFPMETTFYGGLILVAIGTGFLKSNISAMVGDLYDKEDERRDAGFSIFYMGINIGGFLAPLVCGYLAQNEQFRSWISGLGFDPNTSWHFGFACAGVGMALGLVQYIVGRRNLSTVGNVPEAVPILAAGEEVQTSEQPKDSAYIVKMVVLIVVAVAIIGVAAATQGFSYALSYVLMPTVVIAALAGVFFTGTQDKLTSDDWKRLAVLMILFTFSTIFWMGFEQAATSFNLFADKLTDNRVFGWEFPASWLQSVNSLLIVIFAPIVGAVWMYLGKRQPSDAVKFSLGLLFAGVGFLVVAYAASLTTGGKVSPLWLVLVYFFHTIGELCLSPVGLSSMTKLAPARMISLMLGVWFLSISLGNYVAGMIAGEFVADAAVLTRIFLIVAAVLVGAAVVLFAISPLVKRLHSEPQEMVPVEPA